MFAILAYIFVRPFVRAGFDKRRELASAQRAKRRSNAYRGPRVKTVLTPDEKEYFAAHVPASARSSR